MSKQTSFEKLVKTIDRLKKKDISFDYSIENLKINKSTFKALLDNNIKTVQELIDFPTEKLKTVIKVKNRYENLNNSLIDYEKRKDNSLRMHIYNNYSQTLSGIMIELNKVDKKYLDYPINMIDLNNTRLENVFKKIGINTYYDLCEFGDMSKVKNIGDKCLKSLYIHLKSFYDNLINEENEMADNVKLPTTNDLLYDELFTSFSTKMYKTLFIKNSFDNMSFESSQRIMNGLIINNSSYFINNNDIKILKLRYINNLTYKEIGELNSITRQAVELKIKRLISKMILEFEGKSQKSNLIKVFEYLNMLGDEFIYGYFVYSLNHESIDTNIIKIILKLINIDVSLFKVDFSCKKEIKEKDNLTEENIIIYKAIKSLSKTNKNVTLVSIYNLLNGIDLDKNLTSYKEFGTYHIIDKTAVLRNFIELNICKKIDIKVSKYGRVYCNLKK